MKYEAAYILFSGKVNNTMKFSDFENLPTPINGRYDNAVTLLKAGYNITFPVNPKYNVIIILNYDDSYHKDTTLYIVDRVVEKCKNVHKMYIFGYEAVYLHKSSLSDVMIKSSDIIKHDNNYIDRNNALKYDEFGRNYMMYSLVSPYAYERIKYSLLLLNREEILHKTVRGDNILSLSIKSKQEDISDYLISNYSYLMNDFVDNEGRNINILYTIHFKAPLNIFNNHIDKYGRGWWFYSVSNYESVINNNVKNIKDINGMTYLEYKKSIY